MEGRHLQDRNLPSNFGSPQSSNPGMTGHGMGSQNRPRQSLMNHPSFLQQNMVGCFKIYIIYFRLSSTLTLICISRLVLYINKRSVLRRQSRDTNRNIKMLVYCQYG